MISIFYYMVNVPCPYSRIRKDIPKMIKELAEYGMIGNSVRLEASSMCQLKCPICPTSKGKLRKGVIGWGYLKFRDFKKFVDDNPRIKSIELSNWGEMFLNPELNSIIKYAYAKNIALDAENGVNLNTVSEETIRYLTKYRFRYLSISIDGATNKTYQMYRRGGNLNKVIENIKRINYYKKKYNTKFPKLSWQFVIFGHNEHELPIAKKLAKNLGMSFKATLNHTPSYSPVKDKDFVKRESGLDVASREEFRKRHKKDNLMFCDQLWSLPQINWDGKLLGCCTNIWGDFGNVFELGLETCLKSEKYIYTKKMLLGRKKERKDIPCSKCKIYRDCIKPTLKNNFIDHKNRYIYIPPRYP